jgi:hypothetical protein
MTAMPLHLFQLLDEDGRRIVAAAVGDGIAYRVDGVATTLELARAAIGAGGSLDEASAERRSREEIDLAKAEAQGRLLPPIEHEDSAHLFLSGTGLTHLGSAESRDRMHREHAGDQPTDSLRMFRDGLAGGKPAVGATGVEPEWFYKGNGDCVVGTGADLAAPSFALDGSEEPELAAVYVVDADGCPCRIGFCLANEFSDHVTEKRNYLSLAHSKLRPAALGPELVTSLPADVRGTSRIRRNGNLLWEKPFLTGEENMSHSLANLEYHHFKYDLFRKPGDVHVHFLGTATLSFADGLRTEPGDEFEIEAAPFRLALRNRLVCAEEARWQVRKL